MKAKLFTLELTKPIVVTMVAESESEALREALEEDTNDQDDSSWVQAVPEVKIVSVEDR